MSLSVEIFVDFVPSEAGWRPAMSKTFYPTCLKWPTVLRMEGCKNEQDGYTGATYMATSLAKSSRVGAVGACDASGRRCRLSVLNGMTAARTLYYLDFSV
jgi:hypothetical protein